MSSLSEENEQLKQRVAELEQQVKDLQSQLQSASSSSSSSSSPSSTTTDSEQALFDDIASLEIDYSSFTKDSLDNDEIARFSRQLLTPYIGMKGQLNICNSSVLVIGAGGLGAPVTMYLAGTGIGRIGLVDFDTVEVSNLHRQVMHRESRVGMAKTRSGLMSAKAINSKLRVNEHNEALSVDNARQLISQYDIVVDASDNIATRYLVNDACILEGKPLVSGSALKMEGQLSVYGYKGSPCYRCLHPKPPPANTIQNCSDGGVLGVVPGIIGVLQALEVLKIASGQDPSYNQKMLFFDGEDGSFRVSKMRPRNPECDVCGDYPTITELIDYQLFCGSKKPRPELADENVMSVQELEQLLESGEPHVLLDVRAPIQFDICHLDSSWNVPLSDLEDYFENVMERANGKPIVTLCRRGNASHHAAKWFLDHGVHDVKSVEGGLTAWSKQIDLDFPLY
eukprot:TRINITY_DN4373_c2_g1_i2.p1 TRINITY_DN4373_c2_g1~~TRINITY_DN4373_c2_g1_i2.p1  ORF type:complete len:496 (-),score=166.97 TRINITY_DN4373_c2_g1_i2:71-1429(-)